MTLTEQTFNKPYSEDTAKKLTPRSKKLLKMNIVELKY